MFKYLIHIVLICSPLLLFGQTGIEGTWKGTITQYEGGFRTEYGMELMLNLQDDGKLTGKSYVYVDDIYAIMEVEGSLFNKVFIKLEDTKIVDSKIVERLQWCIKNYQLTLKEAGSSLEGFWQGSTKDSQCIPGRIFLRRKTPKA